MTSIQGLAAMLDLSSYDASAGSQQQDINMEFTEQLLHSGFGSQQSAPTTPIQPIAMNNMNLLVSSLAIDDTNSARMMPPPIMTGSAGFPTENMFYNNSPLSFPRVLIPNVIQDGSNQIQTPSSANKFAAMQQGFLMPMVTSYSPRTPRTPRINVPIAPKPSQDAQTPITPTPIMAHGSLSALPMGSANGPSPFNFPLLPMVGMNIPTLGSSMPFPGPSRRRNSAPAIVCTDEEMCRMNSIVNQVVMDSKVNLARRNSIANNDREIEEKFKTYLDQSLFETIQETEEETLDIATAAGTALETESTETLAASKSSLESSESSSASTLEKSASTSSLASKSSAVKSCTGERHFACSLCPNSFRRLHDLKRHVRSIHTGVKPYLCLNCNKTFSRLDALKRHMTRLGSSCPVPKKN